MNLETIERDGKRFAVVPIERYLKLLEDVEMLTDLRDFREAKASKEESFPATIVNRIILHGENPIRVFREYRGLTQQQLADRVGIQRAYLAEIETGRKMGAVKTLKAIAQALDLSLEDIA